jgi:hypothetical protein
VLTALQQPGQRLSTVRFARTIKVPDSFSLSVAHEVNPQLQLLGDDLVDGLEHIPKLEFTRDTGRRAEQRRVRLEGHVALLGRRASRVNDR